MKKFLFSLLIIFCSMLSICLSSCSSDLSIDDIKGTYTFQTNEGEEFRLVVNDDGRVWRLYRDGSGSVIGEVGQLGKKVFMVDADVKVGMPSIKANTGYVKGITNPVFDTSNHRFYFSVSDYNNSDVDPSIMYAEYDYSPEITPISR